MKKFDVVLKIDPFRYEDIEAENEEEAKEIAFLTLFDDIHHSPTSIVSDIVITKSKINKNGRKRK